MRTQLRSCYKPQTDRDMKDHVRIISRISRPTELANMTRNAHYSTGRLICLGLSVCERGELRCVEGRLYAAAVRRHWREVGREGGRRNNAAINHEHIQYQLIKSVKSSAHSYVNGQVEKPDCTCILNAL
jgi:hypothetical protein